jgi:TM2 domain-containing membrane protein YozV
VEAISYTGILFTLVGLFWVALIIGSVVYVIVKIARQGRQINELNGKVDTVLAKLNRPIDKQQTTSKSSGTE